MVVVSVVSASPASAQDASGCIVVTNTANPLTARVAQAAHNRCDYEVYMVWCHDGPGDSTCDTGTYYRRGRVMRPDERYFNQYNLPAGKSVHTAACKGRTQPQSFATDGSGGLECSPMALPIDGHTHVRCGSEVVPYRWEVRHKSKKDTIVRLTSSDMIYWAKVDNAMFRKFKSTPAHEAPDTFVGELCGRWSGGEKDGYDQFKEYALDKAKGILDADMEHRHKLADCRESLELSVECKKLLGSDDPGTGVRG